MNRNLVCLGFVIALLSGPVLAAEAVVKPSKWRVNTKAHLAAKLDYGSTDWISAYTGGSGSIIGRGSLEVLPESKFILSETDLFSRKYRGNIRFKDSGKTMRLALSAAGRAGLEKKIHGMMSASPRFEWVSIESTEVVLDKVSRPELQLPKAGTKEDFTFHATGEFQVIWVYDGGWPFIYRSLTVWRFDFEEKVVVGQRL